MKLNNQPRTYEIEMELDFEEMHMLHKKEIRSQTPSHGFNKCSFEVCLFVTQDRLLLLSSCTI